jgi:hypothetical protein
MNQQSAAGFEAAYRVLSFRHIYEATSNTQRYALCVPHPILKVRFACVSFSLAHLQMQQPTESELFKVHCRFPSIPWLAASQPPGEVYTKAGF